MKYFFIGIAGSGMSAVAQYLKGKGHKVSGSDRQFINGGSNETRQKLEALGIKCYPQGEGVLDADTDFAVVSTAIEDTVKEYKAAKDGGVKILHRSDLLAEICNKNFTIAVAGTSGKSTTTAMIFHVLKECGLEPSLITGAGLISLQNKGLIGNAFVGKSDILVIETDESDGTIIKYKPKIGLILNIDKDHKEISELVPLFETFRRNTVETSIVNLDNPLSKKLDSGHNFSCADSSAENYGYGFSQDISGIEFCSGNQKFTLSVIGHHNMENALAAISVARLFKISDDKTAASLSSYEGIFRRNRIVFNDGKIMVMDDFAHNPAKICATLSACQKISKRVLAWFQPHGFAPSKLMKTELIERLSEILREDDIMIFSKIYYAGGTADKSISAEEFAEGLTKNGKKSVYIEDRNLLTGYLKNTVKLGDIILLMGARDTTLSAFAEKIVNAVKN
ncbi:MAG: UDP-N-acetylmuramate--alanine ligase [Bacteroidales bacterium]|nr:UDP-N-acetylmuramate--alanine ligase [Bacteroidales bacterium]